MSQMEILVTGARGFIGSHLVSRLSDIGHNVHCHDADVGDLREYEHVRNVFDQVKPDRVVHLAARVGRLFGEYQLLETLTNNAMVTTNVVIEARRHNSHLIYASTSEIYGDLGQEIAVEGGPQNLPHNFYGLTKRWGEEVARLYLPPDRLTIARLSMPYGPGHPPGIGRAAITNILHQALYGKEIPIHKGSERSWCWIADTIRALVALTEGRTFDGRHIMRAGRFGRVYPGAFNVGRDDDPRSMLEIAHLACDLVGASKDLIKLVDPPAAQTVVKRLATEHAQETLAWFPEISLEDGMAQTLEWVKSFDADGKKIT
jgi:nucleoside-diphosphate-sugar epimerase